MSKHAESKTVEVVIPGGGGGILTANLNRDISALPHIYRECDAQSVELMEKLMANIKQLQDDNYRAGQRLSTMQAQAYTLCAHLTGQPGY